MSVRDIEVAKAFGFPSRFVGVAVDVEGIGEVTSARDNGERGRVVTFDVDGGEDESGCVGDDDDGGEVFGESGEETPSFTFDPVGGEVKVACVVCCPVGICVVAGCCCGGGDGGGDVVVGGGLEIFLEDLRVIPPPVCCVRPPSHSSSSQS